MLDKEKFMVIIKGKIKDNVEKCEYDETIDIVVVKYNGKEKNYEYYWWNVELIVEPVEVDFSKCIYTTEWGNRLNNINKCLKFKGSEDSYLRMFFEDGTIKSYVESKLKIERNCLSSEHPKLLFDYYKKVSEITGMRDKNGNNTLHPKFEKIGSVSECTVLAKYLNAVRATEYNVGDDAVIFPFGCNLSQINAVKNALYNQVSVIEGPPGTGKTQTILNIIANLLVRGKTVAVVSSNNSATENVYEKLQNNGYAYVAAELGSKDNKIEFIDKKQYGYPDFKEDFIEREKLDFIINGIKELGSSLIEMLEDKIRLQSLQRELSGLVLEKRYFDEYFTAFYEDELIFKNTKQISLSTVLNLWNDCQIIAETGKKIGLWSKLQYLIRYKQDSFCLFRYDVAELIPQLQKLFYVFKKSEIEQEISNLEAKLSDFDFPKKLQQLSDDSSLYLKHSLAEKYGQSEKRQKFEFDDLSGNSKSFLDEYPVVLSTTYSVISSLNGVVYDYVIVDEASQVDLTTGVLAMACAKNTVIVGDLKQLSNIITKEIKPKISSISNELEIPAEYRHEEHSLLSSVCEVFKDAPRVLLREHYRCHPKIIEFCNQKFYNNQLIIMTSNKEEHDVLKVHITAPGDHARDQVNPRQIAVIIEDIIPELNSSDLGVIAPYKKQTFEIVRQLSEGISISTVHKFQGREKDDVIISTVDNEIGDFVDEPKMLNVAVSRAKNRLRLVLSDNEANEKTNIGDLVKYIKYNNFEIVHSEISSVFDMLYKCFDETRREYLARHKKVSEYDSENLMYSVIEKVLQKDRFSMLDVNFNYPLHLIFTDLTKLNLQERKFVENDWAHVDFLIYTRFDNAPLLAIEVDGYEYHKEDTPQSARDRLKDGIFEKFEISLVRFSTIGDSEEEKLTNRLDTLLNGVP